MAMENVKKFMEKIGEDKALQARLEGKKADDIIILASEMGFDFTKDELKSFVTGMEPLSPDMLEVAAGGSSSDFEHVVDDIRDGMATGIEAVVDGANWVGDKVKVGYAFVSTVIGSWFD